MVILSNWGAIHWLALGLLLLIGEILVSGVFLMWWGISGLILAGITFFLPLSLSVSISIYAIVALALSFLWWRYQSKQDEKADKETELNNRANQMLHQYGQVIELNAIGEGRAKFGDTTWKVQGQGLRVGMMVVVKRVDGIVLTVEPIQ